MCGIVACRVAGPHPTTCSPPSRRSSTAATTPSASRCRRPTVGPCGCEACAGSAISPSGCGASRPRSSPARESGTPAGRRTAASRSATRHPHFRLQRVDSCRAQRNHPELGRVTVRPRGHGPRVLVRCGQRGGRPPGRRRARGRGRPRGRTRSRDRPVRRFGGDRCHGFALREDRRRQPPRSARGRGIAVRSVPSRATSARSGRGSVRSRCSGTAMSSNCPCRSHGREPPRAGRP